MNDQIKLDLDEPNETAEPNIKAIIINPYEKTIVECYIKPGIDALYEAIKCRVFCTVMVTTSNVMFLDDEGLLTLTPETTKNLWSLHDYPSPLSGIAVVLGVGPDGSSIDTTLTVADIQQLTSWELPLDLEI
jgi:hypothetical protein